MGKEIKTVLVSAFDKDGLPEFVQDIQDAAEGVVVYGSRGSANALNEAGVEAQNVSTITGTEPWLDHRVATLSEEVAAGLLADNTLDHQQQLDERGIPRIDLVAVDLYPLIKAVRDPNATEKDVIDKTDVGGPTMLHAGAKGRRIVVSRPGQRQEVIEWLKAGQPDEEEFRRQLAAIAEWEAARHILESALYIGGEAMVGFMGERVGNGFKGENGGQRGAFYVDRYAQENPLALRHFKLHREKESELGYNNRTDISRSMQTLTHIVAGFERNFGKTERYYGLGVKHGNPCGAGIAETPEEAIIKTIEGDQLALFGGTVTFNFPLDKELATLLMKHNQGAGKNLIDVVVVPGVTEEALEILHRKEGRLRVITNPALEVVDENSMDKSPRMQTTFGGDLLVQDNYGFVLDYSLPELERFGEASPQQLKDMLLAWAICATSNSNTITFVRDGMLIANAVGQQARVYAAELAVGRARRLNHDIKDVAVCSDSFFPFADGPQLLVDAGVGAIFTTRGSKKDQEVFEVFKKAGTVLYTLPDSMARGFSHHAA